jgi:hypothetical protein
VVDIVYVLIPLLAPVVAFLAVALMSAIVTMDLGISEEALAVWRYRGLKAWLALGLIGLLAGLAVYSSDSGLAWFGAILYSICLWLNLVLMFVIFLVAVLNLAKDRSEMVSWHEEKEAEKQEVEPKWQ